MSHCGLFSDLCLFGTKRQIDTDEKDEQDKIDEKGEKGKKDEKDEKRKTRPSILCVTHQNSRKKRKYLLSPTVGYGMMNYKVIPVGT